MTTETPLLTPYETIRAILSPEMIKLFRDSINADSTDEEIAEFLSWVYSLGDIRGRNIAIEAYLKKLPTYNHSWINEDDLACINYLLALIAIAIDKSLIRMSSASSKAIFTADIVAGIHGSKP